jgi:uncharacterized membrane protein YdjX (TVP38/TMEM64 family)
MSLAPARRDLLRRLPFLTILAVAAVGAILLHDRLSFAALAEHRAALTAWRDANPLLAPAAFVAVYALLVAFSLPGATVATLTGGYLFGTFPGVLYNVAGATLGALAIFSAARSGFGVRFAARLKDRGGRIARLEAGLRQNEWSVLFLMRLAPVVPFVVANLVPAFLGVSPFRFAVTTLLGILPGALVFTSVGAGLGEVFARGAAPDLGVIFEPPVLLPLLGLCALALVPLLVRAVRR